MMNMKKVIMVLLVVMLSISQTPKIAMASTDESSETEIIEMPDLESTISPYWSYLMSVAMGTYVTKTSGLWAGAGVACGTVVIKNGAGCGLRITLFEESKSGGVYNQIDTWYASNTTCGTSYFTAYLNGVTAFYRNRNYRTRYQYYAYDAKGNVLESYTETRYYYITY